MAALHRAGTWTLADPTAELLTEPIYYRGRCIRCENRLRREVYVEFVGKVFVSDKRRVATGSCPICGQSVSGPRRDPGYSPGPAAGRS